MDNKITQDFHTRVKSILELNKDQEKLYSSLKKYQQDRDVAALVNSLQSLLASPDRVTLFDDLRPFVSVTQQVEYNNLCPVPPSKKARVVHLTRHGSEPLGFKFRGGLEHGVGLYISEVTPNSQAEQRGLQPGDEILHVNGFNVSQVTHNEALAAMKLKRMLTLKVIAIGLVPVKDSVSDPVTWTFIKKQSSQERVPLAEIDADPNRKIVTKERTIFVNLVEGQKLGCGISSGQVNRPGIFVHKVNPGTMADKLGFQVGDQIVSVNDTSFQDISHAEALVELKSSNHLTIVLRSWEENAVQVEPVQSRLTTSNSAQENKKGNDKGRPQDSKTQVPGLEDGAPVSKKSDQTEKTDWWSGDPYTMFTSRQIDGREVRKVEIVKDGPLEMYVEGGLDSPLAGKVVIAEVLEGGAADRNGAICKGDQVLMLEGQKMIDVELEAAQAAFKEQMKGKLDGSEKLRLIIAVAPPKNYEDEVTFF